MIGKLKFSLFLIFISIGLLAQNKPSLDSLISEYNNAIYDSTKIQVAYEMGVFYTNSQLDTVLSYFNKALLLAEENEYYNDLVKLHNRIGSAFFYTGGYDRVLTHYYKSLEFLGLEKNTNKQELLSIYFNIGLVYNSLTKYEKSREYYQKALQLATHEVYPDDTIPMKQIKARILNNIGISYYSQKKNEEALKYYNKAIQIAEDINFPYVISLAYNNIGNIYKDRNSIDIALSFYNKSLQIKKQTKDYKGVALTYYYMAESLMAVKNNKEAIPKYEIAYKIADSTSYIELKKEISQGLAEAYAINKNFKKSFEWYKDYKELSDSINISNSLQKATQLEMQYKFDRIQKEIQLKQQRREFK